jgi:peptide chain release factor subunit 3
MEIPRKTDGTLLITVADRYKDMGTVVLGKVESGRVRKGQTVMLMPNKKTTEIIGIAMEETELTSARVGDSVRLRLKNVEEDVSRQTPNAFDLPFI